MRACIYNISAYLVPHKAQRQYRPWSTSKHGHSSPHCQESRYVTNHTHIHTKSRHTSRTTCWVEQAFAYKVNKSRKSCDPILRSYCARWLWFTFQFSALTINNKACIMKHLVWHNKLTSTATKTIIATLVNKCETWKNGSKHTVIKFSELVTKCINTDKWVHKRTWGRLSHMTYELWHHIVSHIM